MEHNIFLFAGIISVVFVLAKMVEMRFVDKDEPRPMKLLVRDALVVYVSVVCGDFMIDQLKPFITPEHTTTVPEVFVDAPDF
jgi:hypothetical protein